MKILMVNNQLSILGGSETYMFSVGEELAKRGHDVQYFGTPDIYGNHTNKFGIYAKKSLNILSIKKNNRNARRFSRLLDLFKPDIVHINLMYYVLTPEIVNEAVKRKIPVIHTVHDSKIVCPNHRLYIPQKEEPCLKCADGNLNNCIKNKCVKNSFLLSSLAVGESKYYQKNHLYKKISKYIFPSEFMKNIHIGHDIDEEQSIVLHNFSRIKKEFCVDSYKLNDKYVLYFGRISVEKGMKVLAEVIGSTPNIRYKIVGEGTCSHLFEEFNNCELLGFLSGDNLLNVIKRASFCVFPSIWFENCPMSIQESIALGVPVIGTNIGGIPELIDDGKTGFLIPPSDAAELKTKIERLYFDNQMIMKMSKTCIASSTLKDVSNYVDDLEKVYRSVSIF